MGIKNSEQVCTTPYILADEFNHCATNAKVGA